MYFNIHTIFLPIRNCLGLYAKQKAGRDPATDCIFCRLVRGDLPSHKVYEDNAVVALVSTSTQVVPSSINPGRILVIPKAHIGNIYGVGDGVYIRMTRLVGRIAPAIKTVFKPLYVMMEPSDVGHVHVQLVPVYELHGHAPQDLIGQQEAQSPPQQELARIAHDLAAYIASHP